jgi:calcineurin-like phosphoesterase family protein
MTNFWTSDLHLGHRNIARLARRPFDDSDAGVVSMNDHLIDAWNELVGPDDTVFVLGDICMGRLADSLLLVSRLHGTKHLIAGNHDRCWVGNDQPLSSVSARHRDYIDAGFASVSESGRVELVRQQVEMSHFPYKPATPSSDAERRPREVQYDRFRPIDTGGWLLHGHVHGAYRQLGRQINVGVDAWGGRPVSEDEIVQLIIDGERDLGPLPWECRA